MRNTLSRWWGKGVETLSMVGILIVLGIPILTGFFLSLLYKQITKNPVTLRRNKVRKAWEKDGFNGLARAMRSLRTPCVRCPSCRGKPRWALNCPLCRGHRSLFKKDFVRDYH